MLYTARRAISVPGRRFLKTELIHSLDTTRSLLSLLVLTALSAFFSASETAFSSANKVRLETLAEAGDRRARRALSVVRDFDRTLSVILIGNNIVNIGASSVATVAAMRVFGSAGAAVATGATTLLILTFGEVLPKSYAKEKADSLVLSLSGVLRLIILLLTPLACVFVLLQSFAQRLWGRDKSPLVTEEELRSIIEASEEEGVLDEQRGELMRSALRFDDTTVQEVLTPRVDMAAIDVDASPEEIRRAVLTERYTRMPVYEKDPDHILGVLQTRDYLEALLRGETPDLRGMLTQPLFAHRTMPISDLLASFKREQRHIAVVLDDFGGTMGIVTMEDLLEELVGEIYDEDEEAEAEIVRKGEGVWSVSGDCPVDDAAERVGLFPREIHTEAASVGGWAAEMLGHVPAEGDRFCVGGAEVTVERMEDQRVAWVTVSALPAAGNEGK